MKGSRGPPLHSRAKQLMNRNSFWYSSYKKIYYERLKRSAFAFESKAVNWTLVRAMMWILQIVWRSLLNCLHVRHRTYDMRRSQYSPQTLQFVNVSIISVKLGLPHKVRPASFAAGRYTYNIARLKRIRKFFAQLRCFGGLRRRKGPSFNSSIHLFFS